MIYGLEEYYNGLIAEAKTPEEIMKVLEYQFVQGKGVPQEVLTNIFQIDPTKKKTYTRWALSQWETEGNNIVEAITNGTLQKVFAYFKERAAEGLDITRYKFSDAVKMLPYDVDSDEVLAKTGDPNDPANKFEIVFKSSEWIVARPYTYEADRKLGQGSCWCTTGYYNDSNSYWEHYTKYGPLWVNFDLRTSEISNVNHKEYPYKRYQFLFEYNNYKGELRDLEDKSVVEQVQDIIPKDVIDFYKSIDERYARTIYGGKTPEEVEMERRFLEERLAAGTVYSQSPMVRILPTTAHTQDWHLPPEEQRTYMLYGQDLNDPYAYCKIDKNATVTNEGHNTFIVHNYKYVNIEPDYYDDSEYVYNGEDKVGENLAILFYFENERERIMHIFYNVKDSHDFGPYTVLHCGNDDYHFTDYYAIYDGVHYWYTEQFNGHNSFLNTQITRRTGLFTFQGVCYLRIYEKNGPRTIIHNDIPFQGKEFMMEDDGTIKGKYLTYNINKKYQYQVDFSCGFSKEYFVVVYVDSTKDIRKGSYGGYYDEENDEWIDTMNIVGPEGDFLFKKPVEHISLTNHFPGLVIVGDNEQEYVYSPDLRKQLSKSYDAIRDGFPSHMLSNYSANENGFFIGGELDETGLGGELFHINPKTLKMTVLGEQITRFEKYYDRNSRSDIFYCFTVGDDGCIRRAAYLTNEKKGRLRTYSGIKPTGYAIIHCYDGLDVVPFDDNYFYEIQGMELEEHEFTDEAREKMQNDPYTEVRMLGRDELDEAKKSFHKILEKLNNPFNGGAYV